MKIFQLIKEINSLPKVKIKFTGCNKESISAYKRMYQHFTKRHRLKIIKNKTIGVGLIDLYEYENYEDFMKKHNGKNSMAYDTRKATKRGYKLIELDRNKYIDDIYDINTSMEERQGRKMSQSYLKKIDRYEDEDGYKYFGVINSEGKLVSYLYVLFAGEVAIVDVLLGHKKYQRDGIMLFMLASFYEIVFNEYKDRGYKYIMYDTFFGASEGLQKFKKKSGYKAYKVVWVWDC